MQIIIYNPNSRGGNYDYALKLFDSYLKNKKNHDVQLILPVNALAPDGLTAHRSLINDAPNTRIKLFSQLYFLFRSIVNPIKFFFWLRGKSGVIIFNDYDQTTSFLWVPLFKLFRKNFIYSVILHDPDRDHYFRFKFLSNKTMKKVMSLMNIAFYHDSLPEREYYSSHKTQYVSVPHGLYSINASVQKSETLNLKLTSFKGADLLIGAIGNIRLEKNYSMILNALVKVSGVKLLISGIPANTSVRMESLKKQVTDLNLQDRVLIYEKYADHAELKAIGQNCDAFILYYSTTFKSQSGILNLFASFQKPLLVSDNGSPLSAIVKKFQIGILAAPDSESDLINMLSHFKRNEIPIAHWKEFFEYASWEKHVSIAVKAFDDFRK